MWCEYNAAYYQTCTQTKGHNFNKQAVGRQAVLNYKQNLWKTESYIKGNKKTLMDKRTILVREQFLRDNNRMIKNHEIFMYKSMLCTICTLVWGNLHTQKNKLSI